jgi:hypothetical protein
LKDASRSVHSWNPRYIRATMPTFDHLIYETPGRPRRAHHPQARRDAQFAEALYGADAMRNHKTVGTWCGFACAGAESQMAREKELCIGLCERWRNIAKPSNRRGSNQLSADFCHSSFRERRSKSANPVLSFAIDCA